jgi:hypothetical protein
MQKVTQRGNNVLAAIAGARVALAEGRLTGYRPLEGSASGPVQQTPMASWGPLMKR